MSIVRVQGLLDAQLKTVVGLPPLQLENKRMTAASTGFSRATINPANSTVLTLGMNAKRELQGIYQVDTYVPQDTGSVAAHTVADAIVAAFPNGLFLTDGVITVRIIVASVLFASSLDKFYGVPVSIQWSAFV